MRIVSIFAGRLFSFHYNDEAENELKRLLNLWNDPEYLHNFIYRHKHDIAGQSVETIVQQILDNIEEIEQRLYEFATGEFEKLDTFFKPLDNLEYQLKVLSRQKGRKNYLRIYAIKIDENCFVITGGAIKFTHLMEEREHTINELKKLDRCKQFLNEHGVFDNDSFYGFLNEQ